MTLWVFFKRNPQSYRSLSKETLNVKSLLQREQVASLFLKGTLWVILWVSFKSDPQSHRSLSFERDPQATNRKTLLKGTADCR